jgi:tetratricopeptide (TPR) repeat protein
MSDMSDLMARPTGRQCPGDDVLAAYLDDRLNADERRAVEEHLASCEDCRTLVAESVRALEALDEGEQEQEQEQNAQRVVTNAETTTIPFPATGAGADAKAGARATTRAQTHAQARARRMWPAIGLLAAAALLLFVARVPLGRLMGFGPERARIDAQAALVAAVADQRTFEPRLAGGFRYAPVQGVMRSGDPRAVPLKPEVTIATAQIAQLATRDKSADAQALLGAARLIAGDADGAILALQAASLAQPANASTLSDLSAAYYVRAERTGRATDYSQALDAAKSAIAINPRLPEARFNLALATERTQPAAEARQAWDAYLQLDPSSAWAEEARRHLANLPH